MCSSDLIQIKIYSEGTLLLENIINAGNQTFGMVGYVFFFFLLIMLVLMTATDKNMMLIIMIVGLVLSGGMALISGDIFVKGSAIGFITFAIGILLWKLNKGKPI